MATGRDGFWASLPLTVTAFWPSSPGFGWHVTDPNGNDFPLASSHASLYEWYLDLSSNGPADPGVGSMYFPLGAINGAWHVKIWVATQNSMGQYGHNVIEGDFLVGDPDVFGPGDTGCLMPHSG